MMFLLVLVLLRESTGDTFFYHYGKGNHTLVCNKAAGKDGTVWYGGEDCSSLLTFELMNCNGKGLNRVKKDKLQPCAEKPKDVKSLCTERNVSITAFPSGGIFACKSRMTDKTDYLCPLFTDSDHCNTYDFFLIAIIDSTAEQGISVETRKALKLLPVEENKNFTLSCEFDVTPEHSFAVYWIKDTNPSTCIFSFTNEGGGTFYDANCCINATVKHRRVNISTNPQDQYQRHNITIINATPSDSGRYLCVISTWNQKHKWKIVSNVSVEVRLPDPLEALKNGLLISAVVIGGILLIGGVACFLFQKKKCKGKPSELHHERTQTTVELQDECSPYAESSRNDAERNECVYSLAESPGVHLNGASALPHSKTTSTMPPGENVQAIYAKVNKQR